MTDPASSRRTRTPVTRAEPSPARKTKAPRSLADTPTPSEFGTAARRSPKASAEPAIAAVSIADKPKAKLVRDSFTIPKSEYSVLEGLKVRAANLTRPAKKSELLRAGIAVLSAMSDKEFLAALSDVPSLKTGRPKGSDAVSI